MSKIADIKRFKEIPIDKLVPATWNYKKDDEYIAKSLVNNLKSNGQIENIIIRELKTGFYEIVNGNHRYQAMLQINQDVVICYVYNEGELSDAQAKRIAIETNETAFENDVIKLAALLQEISEETALDELEKTMPYNLKEMENLVALNDFEWTPPALNGGEKNGEEPGDNIGGYVDIADLFKQHGITGLPGELAEQVGDMIRGIKREKNIGKDDGYKAFEVLVDIWGGGNEG